MSPRRSPSQLVGAVLQWVKGRRGRALALSAVFVVFILGLAGMRHSEVRCPIFGGDVHEVTTLAEGSRDVEMEPETVNSGANTDQITDNILEIPNNIHKLPPPNMAPSPPLLTPRTLEDKPRTREQ
jgi:hypothetical protein